MEQTAPDQGADRQTPEASVVVASFGSREALVDCLESLETGAAGAEIVVATCLPAVDIDSLRERFDARFVACPEEAAPSSARMRETRVFRLRSRGLDVARGRVVALLEDHCTVGPGWLDALCAQLSNGPAIAGGPVENARPDSAFAWALYWCEYAALLPPIDPAKVRYVSAVNAAYTRESLAACRDIWSESFFDNEVHDALSAAGCAYRVADRACVRSELPFSFGSGLVHLYTGGRRYGGYRGLEYSRVRRWLFLPGSALIPFVLLARIVRTTRERRPELTATLLRSLPWLPAFLIAWAAGEFVGALNGPETDRASSDSNR